MSEQNTISVQQLEENGIVYLHFEINLPLKDNAEYAFYFFCNNIKINVRWYSSSPCCKFRVDDEGVYHIAAFVKYNGNNPIIYTSQPHQVLFSSKTKGAAPKATVSIFGSCVSRDVLEYENAANIRLVQYVARQSIVSAVSKPIHIKESDINLSSSFQRKQVFNDFNKLSFDLLYREKSQFLLIDLVDERFQLAKYNDSYVTYSQECKNSGLLSENISFVGKEKNISSNGTISYWIENDNLDVFMDIFCRYLISIYPANRIILHRVYGADHYIDSQNELQPFDSNTVSRIKRINAMYEYMYDYIYSKLGKNICDIDISKGYYALQEHKWGLAPIHFQHEYYKSVADKVNTYIQIQMEDTNS